MNTRTLSAVIFTAASLAIGLVTTSVHAQSAALDGAIKKMANVPELQEGDLVFIQSRTDQAVGITTLTKSTITHCGLIFNEEGKGWVVYEGAGLNSSEHYTLAGWWKKELHGKTGGDTAIYIRRVKNAATVLDTTKLAALKAEAAKLHNTQYDKGFQWNNFNTDSPKREYIYCSELLYKAYERTTGVKLGSPHPVKDYLTTPEGKKLLQAFLEKTDKKYFATGKFDENDLIISPTDVMGSTELDVVQPKP